MEEKLSRSDLEELNEAYMSMEAGKDLYDDLNFCLPHGIDTEWVQILSPGVEDDDYLTDSNKPYLFADPSCVSKELICSESSWTDDLSITAKAPNISPEKLGIHFNYQDQSENVSNQPSLKFIAGATNMGDKLLSADFEELKDDCITVEAENMIHDLNFCPSQGNDTESVQVLSPGGEDHRIIFDANKPHPSADQGHEGEDLEVKHKNPDLIDSLSINIRVHDVCPDELGVNFISQNLPEKIFSNQPSLQFFTGKVSYTKEECLQEFIMLLEPSQCTQGCVLKEMLSVDEGEYTEGKHLIHHKSLHHGAYGIVDRCQDSVSGYEFIRKKIPLKKFRPSEVLFPLAIKHTNIMKICGVIQRVKMDGGNVMEILMDNAGMSLAEFVMSRPEKETLSQTLIWDLTKQALEGLSMLHRQEIIHFDIKPENLCIKEDKKGCYILTITDFGSAMTVGQELDFVGWTPEYLAPESCRCYLQHSLNNGMFRNMNNQITGKVDIFALGLSVLFLYQKKHVLLNLLTEGQNSYSGLPMEKKNLMQLQLLLYLATQEDPVGHLISDGCSTEMRDLLSRMLSGPADMRPTAGETLAYMTATMESMSQPAGPRPNALAPKRSITRGRHNPINPQSTTDKGRLVTQPSCNSPEYTPTMAEVPVSQLSLPKSINSLPENETGPIKDHMLRVRLREKLNPYLKTKIWVPKETEASNPTPMVVKSSCITYTQSPTSVALATSKMESCMTEIGHNITPAEHVSVTLSHQIPGTKPVKPSSPTDHSSNMVVLHGNIPNFDVLVNI